MSVWTPELIAEVTRLWGEGLTTAEIGKLVGVTKNAVVGKAHRLGLPPRPSPIRRKGSGGGSASRGTGGVSVTRPVAKPPAKPMRQLALSTSGARCKWPFGHPGNENFHFCGSLALVNKPYCPEHYQMAYLPARAKGEARNSEGAQRHEFARRSASAA